MKYRYAGRGTQTFFIDQERHTVSTVDPRLKDTLELKRKLTKEEADKLGLVPVEQDSKKKKTGEE